MHLQPRLFIALMPLFFWCGAVPDSHLEWASASVGIGSQNKTVEVSAAAFKAAKKKRRKNKRKQITQKMIYSKPCPSETGSLEILLFTVKNNSDFDLEVFGSGENVDGEFTESFDMVAGESKAFSIRLSRDRGALLEFVFVPVDGDGNQIDSLKVIRKDLRLNARKISCLERVEFIIGELVFGAMPTPTPTSTPDPYFEYSVYIRDGDYTCCLEGGKPTYKLLYGPQRDMPLDAIPLATGFPSTASMLSWICNRKVYFHYWASTYAWFGEYRVSSLPCEINA